jgi:GTP-binding protein YchF
MSFNCGIVGLPNVGKSTLFNALTSTQAAEAANFPFCTIEPNKGIVSVPDERLDKLAKLAGSAKTIHTQIEFVDIAGLVKGASGGEGLGNQFLSHIREVDAIIQVIRCFEDENISHVSGKIDPVGDADTIETELILADLESTEKRIPALEKKVKKGDKEAQEELRLIKAAYEQLNEGYPASSANLSSEDMAKLKKLQLITTKPVIYLCNVSEEDAKTGNEYTKKLEEYAESAGRRALTISSKIESEIASLESEGEKQEFLNELGLEQTGLTRVIHACYNLLNLKSYFTVGPSEAKAWTFTDGMTAPQAAGIIHSDFERGFIKAETISYEDYIHYGGESAARDAGRIRLEGKEYLVKDGDVIHFRFNV